MQAIIVLGSARSFGHTRKAVDQTFQGLDIPLIDLNTKVIKPYDYAYQNQEDDFIPLIETILPYELLILATPVYWYSMSAPMKTFIDRFSDLLAIRKDLGRQLRGKKLFVISTFDTSYPRGFEDTFEQTCTYLGITYLGTSFIYSGTDTIEFLNNNQTQIAKAQALFA
jgi:multimeric flavodoxin WrbA